MAYIYGVNGFTRLAAGYPVNINDCNIKPFTLANDSEEVEAGALLMYTAQPNILAGIPVDALAKDVKPAGVVFATNVKLDTVFPQSDGEVTWKPGEAGGFVITGEVAVKFEGAAPAPGDAVYYNIAKQMFTATAEGNVAVSAKFTGNTQGGLTVIDLRF